MTIHKVETENQQYFIGHGEEFRRIVGGIGWPGSRTNGTAVILAEELKEWPPLGRRRFFLLEEREALDVNKLLKLAADLQGKYSVQSSHWYGQATDNPMRSELDHFNKQAPHIYVKDAPDIEHPRVMEKYLRLIKELLDPDNKVLILGSGEKLLKNHYLPLIDEADLKIITPVDYPAIVALGAARDLNWFF